MKAFARRFYPNENAVGKRIKRGKLDSTRPWLTIVGVVRHVQSHSLDSTSGEQLYFPFYQDPDVYNMSIVVRTGVPDPMSLTEAVRAAIQAGDPNQPVFDIATLREIIGESLARRRYSMVLLVAFAAGALALAAVGIYGVMSNAVAQRTHEIGIRVALGAQAGDLLRLMMSQGIALISAGVAIGLCAALVLARLLETLLFGISATDLATYAGDPSAASGGCVTSVLRSGAESNQG